MFYIKHTGSITELKAEIKSNNVFCACPDCGAEVQVDLAELFHDGEGDLETSRVICTNCTKSRLSEEDTDALNDEDALSFDGLISQHEYAKAATEIAYDILHANTLFDRTMWRTHRLEKLTGIRCPDIITTNEARMLLDRLNDLQDKLYEAREKARKLMVVTDSRSPEERLLTAIFEDKGEDAK